MQVFNMFITAVCFIFLIKLRWPMTKSLTWQYLAIPGQYKVKHGNTWQYMAKHGYTWQYMTIHGYTWLYMAIHGYTWQYMAILGSTWAIYVVYVIESAAYGVLFTSCLCQKPERARYERVRAFDTNNS